MKYILLIIFLYFSSLLWGGAVYAQKAILDSLINEIKEHPAQDEQHLKTLNKLSYVYASMQIDSGMVAVEKAIALAQKLNNQAELGVSYANKANLFLKTGKGDEANFLIRKALIISKKLKDDNGIATCYFYLSLYYSGIGENINWAAYIDSAQALVGRNINKNLEADILLNKAYLARNTSDSLAGTLFKEALSLYEKAGNQSGEALAWIGYAASLQNTDSREWITVLNKGARLADSIQDYYAMFVSYGNLCIYHGIRANYSLQAKYLFKSLKICEQMGDVVNVIWSYGSLADLYYYSNNLEKSLKYALLSDSLSREISNSEMLSTALFYIGSFYLKKDETEKALKAFKEMLTLNLGLNNGFRIAQSYTAIAECYSKMGEHKTAIINYQKAAALFSKVNEKFMYAENLIGYGRTIYKALPTELAAVGIAFSEKMKISVEHLQQALRMAKEGRYDNLHRDALFELSNIYEKEGDSKKSFDYYKQYVVLKDSIMNTANANSIANLQVEYDTEKKEEQIALLNKDKQIQHTEIEKQKTTRNAFIGGFVLMLMLGVVTYNRYRVKQKANAAIESTLTQLKNTQQQLIEHENLASLGKFTAATAKEIEVPLNHINNFAALNNELLFKINSKQDAATTDIILNNLKSNFQKINQYGKNADAVVKKVLVTARTLPNKA